MQKYVSYVLIRPGVLRPTVHRVLVGLQGGVLYNREGYVVELWGRILCVVLVYYKGTTYIF